MSEHDTIRKLYHGKIVPRERGIYEGTDFARAAERFRENRRWLRRHVTDEEARRRFNELIRDHRTIAGTEAGEGFRKGFRLGTMLMIDVLRGKSDVFYDVD